MSDRVEEFNNIVDDITDMQKKDKNASIVDRLTRLSILMDSMTGDELRTIYFRNNKEYQLLAGVAKLLPQNHPNRKYIIKLYMDKYLDNMISQNKNIKDALDKGDLNAEELFKEMETYEELSKRSDYVTAGEESYRKRGKRISKSKTKPKLMIAKPAYNKSKITEKKLVSNINAIGNGTNKTRKKIVSKINGLKYKK